MAVLVNRIGDFHVLRIDPAPQGPAELVVIESTAGVDGHAYRSLGVKGEPSSHQTIVDCPSVGHAMVLFRAYQSLIGQRVPVQYGGLDEITEWKYEVVSVRQISISPTGTRVGGVEGSGATGAMLVAEWGLVPELETAEEEA